MACRLLKKRKTRLLLFFHKFRWVEPPAPFNASTRLTLLCKACSLLHCNPSTIDGWNMQPQSKTNGELIAPWWHCSVSECTSTAGAWMKTHARADCIVIRCTSEEKRHFRLLKNSACQSNILWVIIYTFRNYVPAEESVCFTHFTLAGMFGCLCSAYLLSLFIRICYNFETFSFSFDSVLAVFQQKLVCCFADTCCILQLSRKGVLHQKFLGQS